MATEWGGWTWNGALTAFRRSTGPGPGETTGRGQAGRPQKYSPVGREGIGTSTVVRGKGEGGGADRDEQQDDRGSQERRRYFCGSGRYGETH